MSELMTVQDLVDSYEAYIKLLNDELGDLVVHAAVHGWTSSRVLAGELARTQIAAAKKALGVKG